MGGVHFEVRLILFGFFQIDIFLQNGKGLLELLGYLFVDVVHGGDIDFELLKFFV